MEVKFIILAILIILFLAAWISPKTEAGKKVKMNEKLFVISNLILFICGITGFVLTIILGDRIMSTHIFEILLLPAVFAFVLIGVSKTGKGFEEKYDEKQKSDMRDAAVFSWMSIILATFILYAAYSAGNVTGLLFFPIIIYLAFTTYAGSLLYFYKKG